MNELAFAEALSELDLGPLRVEIEELEPAGGGDAFFILAWEGDRVPFVAEFKNARDLRTLQYAVRQARRWAEETKREPLVVVPYLNDDWLGFLRSERMSAIDLSGNAWVQVPGRWSCFQRGFPNRFPDTRPTRAPYRGKSALVGRVLLSRPGFETISEVQEEIERRGGSLSLGQVSKVLSALEKDLVIRKGANGVRLIQPERLLDSLAESYRPPKALKEETLKAKLDEKLFTKLLRESKRSGARIAGYQPARYVIAPEPGERLVVYVESRGFSGAVDASGAERSSRFPNLAIRAIKEPWVFFDAQVESGIEWCSPLETYLQLMQGGKREQEIAVGLRDEILKKAAAAQ
ncbi:MAG: hypothetical protein EA351_10880 [Gemmatimonadales bacterium]|nr:MAG: hypothetical protein EA351_10880 [Gemmatimonadales bacterium]